MLTFIKKYWLFIALASIAVMLFFARYIVKPEEILEPKGTAPSWNEITPGKTKITEVEQRLGKPSSETRLGSKTLHTFPLEEGGPSHKVTTENEVVKLVKEQYYGDEKLDNFKQRYGDPQTELYGPYESMGFKVYVFTKNGIALIASTNDGTILEIWYFEPTSIEEFVKNWGSNLSPQPQNGRF